MENRIINTRVIITVNKRNKLLGCLRKLNSGDTEKVSVSIMGTPKGEPINLFFTRNLITNNFTGIGAVDSFSVYAKYGKPENKKLVLLGSANINSIQKLGFVSAYKKESEECVSITVYTKGQNTPEFKELQDILFSIKKISSYHFLGTSSTTILELKPENQNIISYQVSMLAKNPLESTAVKRAIDSAIDMVHSAEQNLPKYACHSKNSSSTVTESEKRTQEVLRQRHTVDSNRNINTQLEIVIASSIIKSDLKKPLKKWIKILKTEPIEILTDTYFTAGYILGFYIKESTLETNGAVIDNKRIPRYELVAKYSLSDYTINSRDRGITTPGFALKALHNAYVKYKQRKSENLDISHLESLLEKNQKASNQKRDKDLINIIAETLREIEGIGKANASKCSKTATTEDLFCKKAKMSSRKHKEKSPVSFGCSVPNVFIQRLRIKDNKSIDTKNLSAVFEIGNKVFNGTVVKASVDTDTVMASFPIAISVSTGVSLEILIDNDSKKIIQNLLDKTGLETAPVGKLTLRTTTDDNINYGSIQQIGVIWVSRDSLLSNKYSSSNKDTHTAQPYQVPNPIVTILVNDESKAKVKEIIEEANRAKSFPYKLDYNNNCVVRISSNLFDILEYRNKLENILKMRKDIDVGIFALEPTNGLVFKKMFNISSLTVYHSASKNLYALIGA